MALAPALLPMDGDRVGILVAPWANVAETVEHVARADGRFLSIDDHWIVAEGGPGFVSRLRAAGLLHAISADAVTCITDPLRAGRALFSGSKTDIASGSFAASPL